jgi:death-on-curing protein
VSRKEPRWISRAATLAIHEVLLAQHGGSAGIGDEGLLESALASPKNLFAYEKPDIFRLAAAYAHALTRNHPFQDGNKRVALTIAGVFLELNGFRLNAPEVDAVRAMLALSTRELDEEGFASWLRDSSGKVPAQRKGRSGGSAAKAGRRSRHPK